MFLWILFYVTVLLVILKVYVKLSTGWCRSQVCLQGKTVIVTGANTGIGYQTAVDLAKRGARVILACRSEIRAREACERIIKETHNNNVLYKLVDFATLTSVRRFADDIKATEQRLDILVNNAGAIDKDTEKTEDGNQFLMQVNYFGPVLLTELLLDMLKKTSGRIINVSSLSAYYIARDEDMLDLNRYNKDQLYSRSKLCNILYTIELASRLEGTGVTTYSLHPGVVRTEILRNMTPVLQTLATFLIGTFFKNEVEGAQTTIYCSVANGIEKYSGENFHDCQVRKRYSTARDPQLVKRIWKETKTILQLN